MAGVGEVVNIIQSQTYIDYQPCKSCCVEQNAASAFTNPIPIFGGQE